MLTTSLILGTIAALADVVGGLVLVRARGIERYLRYFVALGAGFLIATALVEMVPESLRLSPMWGPILIMSGYCVVHLLEHTRSAKMAVFLGLLVVPAIAIFHWITAVSNASNSYERSRALDFGNLSLLGILGCVSLILAFLVRPKRSDAVAAALELTDPMHPSEEVRTGELVSHHTSNTVMAGLSFHALFDGVAIGSGFALSNWLGWLIFLAILLHKAPEGFTMASVMLASGRGRATAFWSAVALAAATIVGVLAIQLVPQWVPYGLPVSAGVALYVAATDLVPEVNREPGIRMALVFFAGVGGFLLLRMMLPHL